MTLESFIGLFIAMIVVAAIPGPAVFAITTASLSGGFRRGLNMTVGLLFADFTFILLGVSGLALVAESLGALFTVIKYLCAIYLIWMGISLLFSSPQKGDLEQEAVSARSDVLAGFLITISNPKAIVFYVALFPAFIDFNTITSLDVLGIMTCAAIAFSSVNLAYAYLSSSASKLASTSRGSNVIRKLAGTVMVATGIGVATRAQ
ncbi:MAG: LysE family translocator [Pseudomonadota bacterium]